MMATNIGRNKHVTHYSCNDRIVLHRGARAVFEYSDASHGGCERSHGGVASQVSLATQPASSASPAGSPTDAKSSTARLWAGECGSHTKEHDAQYISVLWRQQTWGEQTTGSRKKRKDVITGAVMIWV